MDECLGSSDYARFLEEIDAFDFSNKIKKSIAISQRDEQYNGDPVMNAKPQVISSSLLLQLQMKLCIVLSW